MTSKDAKSFGIKALEAMGATIGQRIVTGLTLALLGFMVTTGKGMVRSVYAQETRKVMAPAVDSMALRDSLTNARIDSLQENVAELKAEQQKTRAEQRAVAGALMDALPAFKKSIEERGQANAEAKRKQKETDQLLDNFTGGTP